ncbi:MAG: transcription-repair coupling factor [Acidobacteria bacterium]|nr:transcription-repair coupling factor [Acidobacteriota bacterium]
MINPGVRDQFHALARHPAFQELLHRLSLDAPGRSQLSGLTPTAKALYLTLLWQALEQPILVVTDTNRSAEVLIELLGTFFELLASGRGAPPPLLIPAHDALPGQGLSPHTEIKAQRAVGLFRLASGKCSIAVTPVASALLRTESRDAYRQLALTLRHGDEIAMEDLAAHLDSIGYERREPVEMEGEYSTRGGIFDIYPAEAHRPIRLEFFGDAVESMRRFDPETQRSVLNVEECTLLPLEETPRTRTLLLELAERLQREDIVPGEAFPGWEFALPLLRPREFSLESLIAHPVIVWDEPESLKVSAERLWKRLDGLSPQAACPPEQIFFQWGELQARQSNRREIEIRELGLEGDTHTALPPLEISSRPCMAFRNNIKAAVDEARTLAAEGNRIAFFAPAQGEVERLADIFSEYSLPFQLGMDLKGTTPDYLADRAYLAMQMASVYLVQGQVRRGAHFPAAKFVIIGSEDLFEANDYAAEPARARSHVALFTPESLDLKLGDYIVHAQHGIGRFTGLRQIASGDSMEDFMVVEYSNDAKLYVPLTRLDLIQKYRGSAEGAPSLDKLGGVTWAKTKSRVKAKMRDMAEELLKLYAERKMAEGFPFSQDSNWQREFEDAFEYSATRDQLQAVTEIKRDLESPHPMDRLLCGDVGFGKTEVAMRAAFKALGDGKQVAVLAPTTVLTLQHFETFKKRFQAFPVRVEMVSRFRSAKEIKAVLADLAQGKVDVLIGTHRLLSKDVEFSDLGLLIVDEEQRFGVRHKERLKQMRKSVDVLTMSATPIPRTLHMSLLGLRDMSVIETPPKDRLAVQTVVAKFNPDLIRTAIEQELQRGGQVYFVHNRVESIWSRAASIQEMLPNARVTVGHGQMGEDELEKVLLGFMHREADVFVCTTIVENGLDISLANTIIIENAQNYGLSELYQLRGRVGRSNRRAYAYLLVPNDGELTEIARKRLAALKEFSDLGAGFKIAALDLELRGAGNLLGGEQHGHISTVGYETYVKLLDETARELRGETVAPEVHSSLNLGLDIRIPPAYIADEQQRLRAYKRIADSGDPKKAATLLAELEDRYGQAPESVRHLVSFSQLKSLAARCGIETIDRRGGGVNIKFHPGAAIDPHRLMQLVSETAGAQFTPAGVLRVPVPPLAPGDLLDALRRHIAQLESY